MTFPMDATGLEKTGQEQRLPRQPDAIYFIYMAADSRRFLSKADGVGQKGDAFTRE